MNQRTRIKICGLTRQEDVQAAITAGADALGFVLYPKSPRAVNLIRLAELTKDLPPFVTPVLLFVNASAKEISDACDLVPNAVLQFHGDETPEECIGIGLSQGRPYIRAARIPRGKEGANFDLVEYAARYAQAQAILLDAHSDGYGGAGKTFDWNQLPPKIDANIVLSGGLNAQNVALGIELLLPRCRSLAVDVSSGVEAEKGIKAHSEIQRFIAAVHSANSAQPAQSAHSANFANKADNTYYIQDSPPPPPKNRHA